MKKIIKILFINFFIVSAWCAYIGSSEGGGIPQKTEHLFLSERPPSGHKGHGGRKVSVEHSEHRAAFFRKFYINLHDLSENAMAFALRPDGSIIEARLNHDEGVWSVTFDTRPMDGTMDGIFNLYVIDKSIVDDTLLIRVAKLSVINHSCGWGHKFKYDKERLRPKYLEQVPLEIVGYNLWDRNFHSRTASGDRFAFSVLHYGRPVSADMRVLTQSGWMKFLRTGNDGNGSFQIIRDYYPERWSEFNARKKSEFLLIAEYETDEKGLFEGRPYNRIRYISTFSWKAQTNRIEYTSYVYGLLIMTLFSIVSGIVVFIYRQKRSSGWK
ncbi:MAG: hypothetical protein ACK415_10110 [Thermodesulfovibrionales bacterium]